MLEDQRGKRATELRPIPEWWKKDLKRLDPNYTTVYNPEYDVFEIKSREAIRKGNVPKWLVFNLAIFKELNEEALTNLRYRKWLGRKYTTTAERIKWIKEMNEEAKAKRREIALEMIAEGFIRIHNFGRKKYFDFGGHYVNNRSKKSRSPKTN